MAAVHRAEDFHMNGGNLKKIQEFLDKQIDYSYHCLGVKSYKKASGEEVSTPGIARAIHQELVVEGTIKESFRGRSNTQVKSLWIDTLMSWKK